MVYQVAKATSDEVRAKNNDAVSKGVYDFHTGLSCWLENMQFLMLCVCMIVHIGAQC